MVSKDCFSVRSLCSFRSFIFLSLMAIAILISPVGARAQDCNALIPGAGLPGKTDDQVINECLNIVGYARLTITGSSNPFKIYAPIVFPETSGKQLTGAGNNDSGTVIEPQYACGQPSPFVVDNKYQPVILVKKSPNGVVSNFKLSLKNLRQSCGYTGNFAIRVDKSPGSQVTSLRVVGSQYGTSGYTTGWANGGGILVVNSANAVVNNNIIKDLGYIQGSNGGGPGASGIQIENSLQVSVQNNSITRVSFGIEIVNKSPQGGFTGDSSYTTVSGNSIIGAANIGCPSCSGGRALKIIACSSLGDELPLRYLTVTNNIASNWGGPNQGSVSPSGLDLHCGIEYSTFTGNNFTGDNKASYALQIRSSFNSPQRATHHNVFNNNTFSVAGCSGCYDVKFNDDGPDQGSGGSSGTPSIGRVVHGTNTYVSTAPSSTYRGCSQFAHAWWDYPPGQNFVYRGQSITLAASGIRPSLFLTVTFIFKDPNGNVVDSITYPGGTSNCVMNQQSFVISSSKFVTPGLYKVFATYWDGNSDAQIVNDWIGTQGQQVSLDVR
jgi:hypothetical protein